METEDRTLGMTFAKLREAYARVIEQRDEAIRVLRLLEWSARFSTGGCRHCPDCAGVDASMLSIPGFRRANIGHHATCRLAAAIGDQVKPESEGNREQA